MKTMSQLLESIESEQFEECLQRFPQFLRAAWEETMSDTTWETEEIDKKLDDLDDIMPVEYQDEYDRNLLGIISKEDENGWYEDAYMKKIVHRGKDLRNHILDYLKENIMEDVYHEYPELFENPSKRFLEG